MGKKNCELGEEDIARICNAFLDFKETEQSKIFDNEAFGYWKVTVERPLRLEGIDPNRAYKAKEVKPTSVVARMATAMRYFAVIPRPFIASSLAPSPDRRTA